MAENCPSKDQLQGMLEGTIPEGQLETIRIHLGDCASCRQTLDRLTNWSSVFSQALVKSGKRDEVEDLQDSVGLEIPGFLLGKILGRGGHGVVYQATNVNLRREVAIKWLKSGVTTTQEEKQRFRINAEAMARLQDPHIVSLFSFGEAANQPYLEMEYVSGGSLAEIAKSPLPTPMEVAEILRQIATGIQHAHDKGVLHRDLKPGNVLLEPISPGNPNKKLSGYRAKVTDFGLAKLLDGPNQGTPSMAIMGTPGYMAPEMAFGLSAKVGKATDIYGIGAIGYELITGFPPFQGATPFDSLVRVREEDPIPPRNLRRDLPRDLETILLKSMEKDPARRYPSAEAMAQDLERFIQGKPVLARPIGSVQKAWRVAKRHPVVSGLSATLAVVVGGSLVGLSVLYARAVEGKRLADEMRTKAEDRLGIARGILKLATQNSEERFFYPQTIQPKNKNEVLLLYRFNETMAEEIRDNDEAIYECAYGMLQQAGKMLNFNDPKMTRELSFKPTELLGVIAKRNPDNTKYWGAYAEGNMQLSAYSENKNLNEENFQYVLKAIEIERELVKKHPKNNHFKSNLSSFERKLVQKMWEEGKLKEACDTQKNIVDLCRELVKIYPTADERRDFKCISIFQYGELLSKVDPDPVVYLGLMEELAGDVRYCLKEFPLKTGSYLSNIVVFAHIASVYHYLGKTKEEELSTKEAIALTKKVMEENPGYWLAREFWIGARSTEYFRLAMNQPELADLYAREWVKELEELSKKFPEVESYQIELARQLCRSRPTAEGARDPGRGLELLEKVFKKNPSLRDHHWETYSLVLSQNGQYQASLDLLKEKSVDRWFSGSLHWEYFTPLLKVKCLWELGQKDQAKAEFQKISEKLKTDYMLPLNVVYLKTQVQDLIGENQGKVAGK